MLTPALAITTSGTPCAAMQAWPAATIATSGTTPAWVVPSRTGSASATIPATDPADAAEGWAEWHDRSSAEYRIASGREEIVIVRDAETGEQREWIVRGEAMPYYTARIGESPTIRAQVAPGRWEGVPRRSEDNE